MSSDKGNHNMTSDEIQLDREIKRVYARDYDELKREYCECDRKIRGNIQKLLSNADIQNASDIAPSNQSCDPFKAYHILGEDEILDAYRLYETNHKKGTLIKPKLSNAVFELTPSEKENNKCLVFDEDGRIIDYISINSAEKIEWDKNRYQRASVYGQECRYIKINSSIYDLLNPNDILEILVKPKALKLKDNIEDIDWFTKLIEYDQADMRLVRMLDEEEERLFSFWSENVIDAMVSATRVKGLDATEKEFYELALDYCNNNFIVLSRQDIRAAVKNQLSFIERFIIKQEDVTGYLCLKGYEKYFNTNCNDNENIDRSDLDKLEPFWADIDILGIGKEIIEDGEETVISKYVELVKDYCIQNSINVDFKIIENSVIEVVNSVSGDFISNSYDFDEDNLEEMEDYEPDTDELLALIIARAKYSFERALLAPLAYMAVKTALYRNEDFYGFERVVAQLVANGEVDYGEYLDNFLSKETRDWQSDEAVPYGKSLVGWATNYREFLWLKAFFPDDAPRSKRKYISAKRNNSKKYLELKKLAESKGYYLDDDAWKNDAYL